MATAKNSNRSKRKYGESQKARTARNKDTKQKRHERRLARFEQRAFDLVDQTVQFEGHKKTQGVVVDVTESKVGPREIVIETEDGRTLHRLRKQIKPVLT